MSSADNVRSDGPAAESPPPRQVVTIHLRNIPLLSGLDSEQLTRVGGQMKFRNFERGSYVVHKGGPGDCLIFLLSGALKVVDLTEDGREITISTLKPGDYAGELSVIDGLARSASLVAAESTLVGLLPRPAALDLIYSNATVAQKVMKRLAAKVRQASEQRAILSIPSAFQRVFALLCDLAPPGLNEEVCVIENPPTQQEMAATINAARETVSRAMQVLFQKGIIEKDQRRLIIREPAALRRLALEERGNGAAAH